MVNEATKIKFGALAGLYRLALAGLFALREVSDFPAAESRDF